MARSLALVCGFLLLGLARPVVGQDAANASSGGTEPAVLQRLQELEWQVQQLQGDTAAKDSDDAVEAARFLQDCPVCREASAVCDCKHATLTAAEYLKVQLTGFFQVDMGFYHQDDANRATLGDIQDGLGFRRARLAAAGKVAERTSYIMEFDFAQSQPRFVDVWMQFDETPLGKLRVGRFRQPFGMTELTSIRDLPFLERPLVFGTDVFFRQTGVMLSNSAAEDRLTWAVSGFRYLSDSFGNVYADDGGYGVATRVTCLPIEVGKRLLHLGVDYSYKVPGRDLVQLGNTNEFFLSQNPVLGAGGLSVLPIVNVPLFVSTGQIAAQRAQVFSVEAAVALGRLVLQSEARWATVEDETGVVNTFPGAYVHLRYMLTGEAIPFNRTGAVFGRIKPRCPADTKSGTWGAWELAARLSHLDLNGKNLPGPGRRLTDTTIGLNWYLNNQTKFQLNWIYADLNDPMLGDSTANTFALRGQLDY